MKDNGRTFLEPDVPKTNNICPLLDSKGEVLIYSQEVIRNSIAPISNQAVALSNFINTKKVLKAQSSVANSSLIKAKKN